MKMECEAVFSVSRSAYDARITVSYNEDTQDRDWYIEINSYGGSVGMHHPEEGRELIDDLTQMIEKAEDYLESSSRVI
jgi:hypothetical protein